MDINLEKPIHSSLSQLLLFLLSFVDDALLLLLSRLGLHIDWLEWLSPVIMIGMLGYWIMRLCRNFNVLEFISKKQRIDEYVTALIPIPKEAQHQ